MNMKELYDQVNGTTMPSFENQFHNLIAGLNEKINFLAQDMNQINAKNHNATIYWQALDNTVKIPTKRDEDAGYDIYANFTDDIVIKPNETYLFNTGLMSAFPSEFWMEVKERGSTGAIGLSVRSGVIDSGYRGEWKIAITNVNKVPVMFSHNVNKITYIYGKIFKKRLKKIIYPASKAIAQAVLIPLPHSICKPWDESAIAASERGNSGWGASGK